VNKKLTVGAAIALLATSIACKGAGDVQGGGTSMNYHGLCSTEVSKPPAVYVKKGDNVRQAEVRASVYSRCKPTPHGALKSFKLSVALYHSDSVDKPTWVIASPYNVTAKVPDSKGYETTATAHNCVDGYWWIWAQVQGTNNDGSTFNESFTVEQPDSTLKLKCPYSWNG
jgi:hypothetical protein